MYGEPLYTTVFPVDEGDGWMNTTTQWTALGVMGLALMVSIGVGMARTGTATGGDAYAKEQERLGYSVSLSHYVDKSQKLATDWNWQTELGHRVQSEHLRGQWKGTEQEVVGYGVAMDNWSERLHGMQQEQLGLQITLEHQAKRRAQLRQNS